MSASEKGLIEKIRQLPPQRLTQAAARMAEGSFTAVWNNDEDAAYDRM